MATANIDNADQSQAEDQQRGSSALVTGLKLAFATGFLFSAISTLSARGSTADASVLVEDETPHRRLLETSESSSPSYMEHLFEDLKERKKLFDETPPEEVKYWFEYTGPLQVGYQNLKE